MAIAMYCDFHTPTVRYVQDGADWFIVPATRDGWNKRRAWNPAPAYAAAIATEANRVDLYSPALAMQMYGIPEERFR